MNARQVLIELRRRLRLATWAGSGAPLFSIGVFASLTRPRRLVSEAEATQESGTSCQLWPGALLLDSESREFGTARFYARLQRPMAETADLAGELSLVGPEGIEELTRLAVASVEPVAEIDAHRRVSTVYARRGMVYGHTLTLEVEAFVTVAPVYPAPYVLWGDAVTGPAGVTLGWLTDAAGVYGRTGLVLRRAAGTTPPAGPTDGVDVTGLISGSAATDAPLAAGQYSYSIFGVYDPSLEADGSEGSQYSGARSVTVEVV